ncbi:hypothetical protein K431DRAFT_293678 [Polychaeton citri CBS 116435]|uniref:Uncharacterized protein n=1 Tax=Polychaeton citri CBS 116435 TaxID=1314669 RepID=A0A9P4QCC2_9PEZI|nr:hypothetical protein K431DRAFT_293678 [Polychaeton citri CBS 116435]
MNPLTTPLTSAAALLLSTLAATSRAQSDVAECGSVGVFVVLSNTRVCCIGGTLNPSSRPGWPLCTGTATAAGAGTLSCATYVINTGDSYFSQLSEASTSLRQSGTEIQTTIVAGTTAVGDGTATESTRNEATPASGPITGRLTEMNADFQSSNAGTTATPTSLATGSDQSLDSSSSSSAAGAEAVDTNGNLGLAGAAVIALAGLGGLL